MAFWRKSTYQGEFFGLVLLFSGVLTGCFLSFQHRREKDFQVERLDSRLQMVNLRIADDWLEGAQPDSLFLHYASHFDGLRLTLIDTLGHVLYDSEAVGREASLSNHLDRNEVQQALLLGQGHTLRRHSSATERDYFYSALREQEIIVRTALPYDWSLIQSMATGSRYIWITLLITLLVIFASFLITRRLTQNISYLRQFSEKLDRGEEISDLGKFPNDELGALSKHIVDLYARLQTALAEADREHRTALQKEQEKVLIKRQLTNNISHELKTPVSAIRGYLETLILNPEVDPEIRRAFIEKSYAQTERLQQLLQDISLVTRMEEAPRMIEREECDLGEIVREVIDEFRPKSEGRMVISTNITSPMPLYGNQELLSSIFRNLMENALAYSGGNEIRISLLNQSGEAYRLCFSDNGTGIEAHHLDRIFERFYRVDKGRSRKLGGTGLGLSIVKNAVLFHGGIIEVRNRETGGLEFLFTLARHA